MKKTKPDINTMVDFGSPTHTEMNKKLQGWIAAEQERIRANPNADGCIRLCEILKEAKADKRIAASGVASKILEIFYETAADALTTSNASQALKPLHSALTAEQLADNTGRHNGGKTMAKRAEDHEKTLTDAVLQILKNPATSDWSNPEIARWLIQKGFAITSCRRRHKSDGKKPTELSEQTMTDRVEAIRDKYKEGKLTG